MKNKSFYIAENAFLNLGKNKGRNILFGLAIFAVITATVAATAIYNASSAIIKEYKERFGSEVFINPEKQVAGGNRGLEEITGDQAMAFSQSEFLKSSKMESSLACYSSSLSAIGQADKKNSNNVMGREKYGGDLINATMRLRGGFFDDFTNSLRELREGSMPLNDGECIISEPFAIINDLKIGDSISLKADLYNASGKTNAVEIPLIISGIYLDATEEYPTASHASYQNRRNEILTAFETVLKCEGEGLTGVAIQAIYYLKSPEMLESFASEIRSKGLPSGYKVDTDKAAYDKAISPIEGLKSVSLAMLLIVLGLGAIVILLLSSISIRGRKYEIGVLRAMGMKKNKLALGLWLESIMIAAVCFALGLIAGALVTKPISSLLATGGSTMPISVTPITAFEIFVATALLITIAGVVSTSRISKYEPIKILMERD